MPRPTGVTPNSTSNPTIFYSDSASGWVNGLHGIVIWFSKPHGPPSGVCTGHTNPHCSGNNLRTVVVFISAKNAPRCTDRKCDTKRILFSLSAMMVKPLCYMRSRPVADLTLPVAKKFSNFSPMGVCKSMARLIYYKSRSLATSVLRLLLQSFIIFSRTPDKSSSNFSFSSIVYRCPVNKTS